MFQQIKEEEMLDNITDWTMINTLATIGLTVVVMIGFVWIYSELQHMKNMRDTLK